MLDKPRDEAARAIAGRQDHPAPRAEVPGGRSRQMPAGDAMAPQTSEDRPHREGLARRLSRAAMKTLLPILLLAAGYAGYAYLKATRPETPKQPISEQVFAVATVPVQRQTAQPTLSLYGTTVAGREVDIRALVSGRVVTTGEELRDGGRVAAGDTLVAIDPFDYRTGLAEAEAQRAETAARIDELKASIVTEKRSLEHMRAQLALAKSDLERAIALSERGNLAERTVDDRRQIALQREQAVDQSANTLRVWQARLAQSEAAAARLDVAIERARRRLDETVLKAPFDAYVTEVGAQVGRMVGVNDKVAQLIDRNWIEARFVLTDNQFGRLTAAGGKLEDRPVEVRWRLGDTAINYAARIVRIAARVASTTGGVEVFARIDDPLQPTPLRPGAFVEIDVPDVRYDHVVRVPATAIYDGDTVYVVKEGRLDPRRVEVVASAGADHLVRGPLEDGERIAVTRLSTPGKGVAVKEASAP